MTVGRRLSEAIGSWLHLEFCCYRAGLFSESSLKSAVGQVLSSFPIVAKGARVHADFAHMALNPISKPGRKREVDFALVLTAAGLPKTNAQVLVEAKWANSSHCTAESIFNDFLRLAILKAADPGASCIFVLAGTHKSVAKILQDMPFQSGGIKNKGIGSVGSERRLKISKDHTSHITAFTNSIREFRDAGFTIPESFVTRSHGLHPIQSDSGTVDFQSIAWEIVSVSNSPLNLAIW